MSKSIFLSFSYKNTDLRNDLRSLFAAWGGPVEATPVYVDEDVRPGGENAIKTKIIEVMENCRGLILVVGPDVHNSRWIDWEVDAAVRRGIPLIAVRHPKATGGLPNRFTGVSEIEWKPRLIAEAVRGW
jgi:hypothetical protein